MKPTFLSALIHYFGSYAESDQCFATSDEQLFHLRADAEDHAKNTLEDGEVTEYCREDMATLELQEEIGYEHMKTEELLALCAERGITAKKQMGKKKIIALLEESEYYEDAE